MITIKSVSETLATFPSEWKFFTEILLVCACFAIVYVVISTYSIILDTVRNIRLTYSLGALVETILNCIVATVIICAAGLAIITLLVIFMELARTP